MSIELAKRIDELERLVRDLRALVDSQGDTIRALSRLTFPAPVYPSPGLLPPAIPGAPGAPGAPWQRSIVTCGQSQEPFAIRGAAAAPGSVGRAVDPVEWTRTALVTPGHVGGMVEQGREQV